MSIKFRKTTEDELSLILDEGEGYSLEFKQSVNTDLSKELVAFANASGGRVFIGVNDNNQIVGCDTSNKAISQIEDMAASCDPKVAINIEKLTAHNILVIHIPEGANRPHRCNKGFFLRNGANSQKMHTNDITEFIQAEGKVRFDQQLRLDIDWQEALDQKRLNHFLQLADISHPIDNEKLLLNLGAGDYQQGQFYLNQTGILFFAKNPGYRLFHVSVICALFKGTSKAFILDRKEFNGSIIENIDESLLYLHKHLQLRWQITNANTQRQEILELPETALREAIVNALCHRDYLQEGAQVTVEIFDDRVEIYNPGGLPKGLKAEEFGTRSVCRNPLIASLLLRCHYIEKLGTGIDRIRSALTLANCPDVEVRFDTMFTLKFQRPFHVETSEKTSEKMSEKTSEKTLKTADEILRLINDNDQVTIAEMARITGVTTRSIERNLERLQAQNKIKRIGAAKGGHWRIIANNKSVD